jgi:hypothetical protein
VFDGNVEIIGVGQMYEMSINVYFVSEDQLTHPLNAVTGQVVTVKYVSVL